MNSLTTIQDIVQQFTTFIDKLMPSSVIPVIIQLCATSILFIVVTKFVWKPVRKIIKTRQEYVDNQLKQAEEANKAAQEHEAVAKASIDEARTQSMAIIEETNKQVEAHREQAVEELNEELKQRRSRAEEEIEQEKKAAVEDIRKEIIDVAMQASETILNREINEEDNSRLVEDFVKDVVK